MPSTTCGYCGRLSNMEKLTQHIVEVGNVRYAQEVVGAFKCANCERILVARHRRRRDNPLRGQEKHELLNAIPEEDVEWIPKFVYGASFPDTPSHIAAAAKETVECLSSGYRRAAVLMGRAVIEATAKHKNLTEGTLYDKIEAMHEHGLVREHIKEGAHELRKFGNDMAHGDFGDDITGEDAELVITLMREVLQEVFESPAKVQRARAARQARDG